MFVCDGDRQSVGLSDLKDPIVTYLSQLHSEQEGEPTTLYSSFVTQQCFDVLSSGWGKVKST